MELTPSPPMPPPPPPRFTLEPESGLSFRKLLNLEETFGSNWLNKLGIIILVIGVALFLIYQMRELGPPGKVTVGYTVSAAMLGAGLFFERREQWRILARAGIAGGWSLVYFTTYAMYHAPAAHVLASEPADLALLLLAAAGIVIHTLRYNSQVVTGLAFALAFTTVNLSRGTANSLIASAILAAGLAAVAVRRRWFEMELAGMVAAFFNHYLWLRPVIEPMHGRVHDFPGYAASAALLYGYWLIFRASYVLRHTDSRRQELVSTIAAVLNPALLILVMGYQSVHPELAFQFFFGVGAVELILGQLPVTRRRRAAFVVLTALGSALLVAAFPCRYSGARLSVSWMVEAETLLLAGVLLREIVFRRLGMAAALVAWIQMIGADAATVLGQRIYGINGRSRFELALLFAIAAVVLYFNSHWIPRRWQDELATGLERLLFRRMSHMAGVLALAGAWIMWPHAWAAVAWAALGMLLAVAGQRWQAPELSVDGVACAAAAVLRVLFVNLAATHTYQHLPWLTERLLTVALVVLILYAGSRWARLNVLAAAERIPSAYTWAGSLLAGTPAWYELRAVSVAPAWALLALVLLEAGIQRDSWHLRTQAYVGFGAAFARLFFVNLNAAGPPGEISPRVYTTAPLALAFYYVYFRRSSAAHCFLGTITLAALARFEFDLDFVAAAWAALALVLVIAAEKTGRRILVSQGLLLAVGVLFRGIFHNLYERSYFPAPPGHGRVACVGAAVALLFAALPFAFRLRRTEAAPHPAKPLLQIAWLAERRPSRFCSSSRFSC